MSTGKYKDYIALEHSIPPYICDADVDVTFPILDFSYQNIVTVADQP
jgi:hypothetical protein